MDADPTTARYRHDDNTVCQQTPNGFWYHLVEEPDHLGDRCPQEHGDDFGRGDFGMPAIGRLLNLVPNPDLEKTLVMNAEELREYAMHPSMRGKVEPLNLLLTPGHLSVDYGEQGQTIEIGGQAYRVINQILQALVLFAEKNRDYGEPTGEDLGAKGQYADMHRKWKKLRKGLWEGQPLEGESVDEILRDFIGHIGLTLDFIQQEGL